MILSPPPQKKKVPFQFSYQSSGEGTQTFIGFYGFLSVLGMITKAFVPINFFQDELIRLAQRQIQILDNSEHLAHYLFVQF